MTNIILARALTGLVVLASITIVLTWLTLALRVILWLAGKNQPTGLFSSPHWAIGFEVALLVLVRHRAKGVRMTPEEIEALNRLHAGQFDDAAYRHDHKADALAYVTAPRVADPRPVECAGCDSHTPACGKPDFCCDACPCLPTFSGGSFERRDLQPGDVLTDPPRWCGPRLSLTVICLAILAIAILLALLGWGLS